MKSEKELKNNFSIENKGGQINLHIFSATPELGDSEKTAKLVVSEVQNILSKDPDKNFKMFAHIDGSIKKPVVSSKARKIYATINQNRQIKKLALVTNDIVIKTIANFIVAATFSKLNFRIFSNKDEALKWLEG